MGRNYRNYPAADKLRALVVCGPKRLHLEKNKFLKIGGAVGLAKPSISCALYISATLPPTEQKSLLKVLIRNRGSSAIHPHNLVNNALTQIMF